MEFLRRIASGGLPPLPITLLFGLRITDATEGRATAEMPATEWLCNAPHTMSFGFLATMLAGSLRWAAATVALEGRVSMVPSFDAKFLRPLHRPGRFHTDR